MKKMYYKFVIGLAWLTYICYEHHKPDHWWIVLPDDGYNEEIWSYYWVGIKSLIELTLVGIYLYCSFKAIII